jgi:ABC-2 type transport system permease protein
MILRIHNLIVKELIQFRRDWLLTTFILIAPVLQLVLMARSIERGISEQPVVLVDQDRSRMSRQLMAGLDNADELQVRYIVASMAEAQDLLDAGQARLAIMIPTGFDRALSHAGGQQAIQIVADATNTMAASIMMRAASEAVNRFVADLGAARGQVIPQFLDFRTSVKFNPTMDVRHFSIPAQLGFITYQVTLAVASLGLARERELGTLEQLMVTPLRRLELAWGKGIPALGIGGLNFAVMWAITLGLFRVPMNGSPLLLAALTLVFIATEVGWGLVLSTLSRTQQQAILFVFIQAMVDIALSGFLVPVRNMPEVLRIASQFVPLQHYLVIIRSIMLRGAGVQELLPNLVALSALCVGIGLVALRSVARRVE